MGIFAKLKKWNQDLEESIEISKGRDAAGRAFQEFGSLTPKVSLSELIESVTYVNKSEAWKRSCIEELKYLAKQREQLLKEDNK